MEQSGRAEVGSFFLIRDLGLISNGGRRKRPISLIGSVHWLVHLFIHSFIQLIYTDSTEGFGQDRFQIQDRFKSSNVKLIDTEPPIKSITLIDSFIHSFS